MRMTAASVKLKEKAKTDQATFVAMQLGVQSSWYGGEVHVVHVRNWNTEEHVEEHISKQGGKIY